MEETQGVFYPPTNAGGTGGFHDMNQGRTGQGAWEPGSAYQGDWTIEGFVCESFSAPGTLAIGLNRAFDDANQFCADRYGGHLATIHSVQDYEKLAQVAAGWNQPLMIGLKSDGAGNWQWVDGSHVDTDLLVAHSFDGLKGIDETVGVFYPPVCQTGWDNGVHQSNYNPAADGSGTDTCDGDTKDAAHLDHALHDWCAPTPSSPLSAARPVRGRYRGAAAGGASRGARGVSRRGPRPQGQDGRAEGLHLRLER